MNNDYIWSSTPLCLEIIFKCKLVLFHSFTPLVWNKFTFYFIIKQNTYPTVTRIYVSTNTFWNNSISVSWFNSQTTPTLIFQNRPWICFCFLETRTSYNKLWCYFCTCAIVFSDRTLCIYPNLGLEHQNTGKHPHMVIAAPCSLQSANLVLTRPEQLLLSFYN